MAVAQSVGSWVGNRRVTGSKSPYGPKYGGGLVVGEVPVHLLGTAKVLRAPFHGQLPHSDISPLVHVQA